MTAAQTPFLQKLLPDLGGVPGVLLLAIGLLPLWLPLRFLRHLSEWFKNLYVGWLVNRAWDTNHPNERRRPINFLWEKLLAWRWGEFWGLPASLLPLLFGFVNVSLDQPGLRKQRAAADGVILFLTAVVVLYGQARASRQRAAEAARLNDLSAQIDRIGSRVNHLGSEVDRIGSEVNQIGVDLNSIGSEVNSIGSEVNHLGSEVNQIGADLNRVGSEVNSIGSEVNQIGVDLNRLGAEIIAAFKEVGPEAGDDAP